MKILSHQHILALAASTAVALSAVPTQAIMVYEGFDYSAGTLDFNDNGSTGWNTAWTQDSVLNVGFNNAGSNVIDSKTWSTPANYAFAPTGNAAQNDITSNFVGYRQLTAENTVDFGADNTVYFSFLINKASTAGANFNFGFGGTAAAGNFNVGSTPWTGIQFGAGANGNGVQAGSRLANGDKAYLFADGPQGMALGEDLLVVGRLTTFASGASNDTIAFNLYSSSDILPLVDPDTFTYAYGASAQSGVADRITLAASNTGINYTGLGQPTDMIFDEFRMGDTWQSVAIPEPTTGALTSLGLLAILGYRRQRR